MNLINNMEQFDNFVELLPNLEKDEVYFISLSARNKYLTDEEKSYYSLDRTEMFSREIARDKEGLYLAIERMESSLHYRKTKNDKDIPEKALVVYMNINPSSMIKAFYKFQNEMNQEILQAIIGERANNEINYGGLKRLPTKLMNAIQKSRSRKYFIDIDVNLELEKDVNNIITEYKYFMKNNTFATTFRYIITQGGFHILIDTSHIPKKFNLIDGVVLLRSLQGVKEAEFNKNAMIPVPGTLQANKLITMR